MENEKNSQTQTPDMIRNPALTTVQPMQQANHDQNLAPAISAPEKFTSSSTFKLLAITFYFCFVFLGLVGRQIIDQKSDHSGLSGLIILIFFFPPFLIFSIISLRQVIKLKSQGEKVGVRNLAKAGFVALVAVALTAALPHLQSLWDGLF